MSTTLVNDDSEWIHCLDDFDTALNQLSIAQLVQYEGYTMTDLMSAIEINDPRTDSFLSSRPNCQSSPSSASHDDDDQGHTFDPTRLLSTKEIVWVLDELMRLEATFQDGQTLMSTLWNFNYFRPSSLKLFSSTCNSPAPPSSSSIDSNNDVGNEDEKRSSVNSLQEVFRSMLLAVLKTNEIVWEELTKGQVYDHEDVHLNTWSQSFNDLMSSCYDPPPPAQPSRSPLAIPPQQSSNSLSTATIEGEEGKRTVTIDQVLKGLDDSLDWLQRRQQESRRDSRKGNENGEDDDDGALQDLITRVTMRIDLLYMLALLTFPAQTSPKQIENHLTRLNSYIPLLPTTTTTSSSSRDSSSRSYDPPKYLSAIFKPCRTVPLLSTSQPPRTIEPFSVQESYQRSVVVMVKDLEKLCQIWTKWRDAAEKDGEEEKELEGWKEVREYSRYWARRSTSPYIRSLHQSILSSTPSHVFSTSPLLHFSTSFLTTLTPLPRSYFLSTLYHLRLNETSYDHAAHRCLHWLERLSIELVRTSFHLAGQNRQRQWRWIRKSALRGGVWVGFLKETKEIVEVMVRDTLTAGIGSNPVVVEKESFRCVEIAVRTYFAELFVESILSGFEDDMELYSKSERERVWFVVGRLAEEVEGLWEDLQGGKKGDRGGKNDGYVTSKKEEMKSLKEMAKGCFYMSILFPPQPTKFSSPFLPSIPVDPIKADQGRYQQRFDWLGAGDDDDESIFRTKIAYEDYVEEVKRIKTLPRASIVQTGKEAFDRAIEALTAMASVPLADRGTSVCPEYPLRNLASLRRTAFANQATLAAIDDSVDAPLSATPKQEHPWFSTWTFA